MFVTLNYLYRDAANYKNYGSQIFTNNLRLSIDEINERIRSRLIDGEYFSVDRWQLPDLHFATWDNQTDHAWHEYTGIEECTDGNSICDIGEFLMSIPDEIVSYGS